MFNFGEKEKIEKIDDLTLLKCLGKGSFGEVYLTNKEGKSGLFATKKMDREFADLPQVSKYLKNEIAIMRELNHKNIIKLEDVKITKKHYYLVMEYCNGGSLSDCLNKYQELYNKTFSEEIVQYLMRQIIQGLKYIHNKNIIHRDLKLDNILVNFDSDEDKKNVNMMKAEVKIIDFGFATHLKKEDLCYSTLGSPINMDPKILKKLAEKKMGIDDKQLVGYDQKADIWSIGTLCYEMLFGKSAFDSETMGELVQKVESGSYKIPTNVSKELVSFLNGMLQYNAEKRLNANELARHHFLTKNIKDFEPINVKQVSSKIRNNNLNINIKRNNTIWSFFNEEDEKKLNNIPGNYLAPIDSTINEEDEYKQEQVENKRRNTAKIPHIIKNDNYQNYPQDFNNPHEFVKRNTQNYQGYGVGENGIHPYENTNNNMGYVYSNYPPPQPQPQMAPHFPFPMPLVVPSTLKKNESEGDNMNNSSGNYGPHGPMPNPGAPFPGQNPNESEYTYSSGIFQENNSISTGYTSGGGGYIYRYGNGN